jgi:ribosylpyrimidine nucleosidase
MLMATKHTSIDLIGSMIVAGNQTRNKILINGLQVCQHLGMDVPVY